MTSTGAPIDFTATPVADPPDPEVEGRARRSMSLRGLVGQPSTAGER